MSKVNDDIREYAKEKNVCLWEIAHELGMLDFNFSRKLRYELSEHDRLRILNIIDVLASKKEVR